eukprot:TRINITY_DN22059_c0_g1_i1.p1 TRINITY_DN22059_c0_g1~~TRINITY_DN22059_c0_g1_i1.p1  ORF type:complete len:599 (-),score=120.78 TRINITY_DN22059_c0_g1_i1:62-1858(-)
METIGTPTLQTSNPNQSKYEKHKQKSEGPLWCSWCLKHCDHVRTEHALLKRNSYKCDNCCQSTVHCCGCRIGMARKYPTYDDKLCIVCDRTIKSWNSKDIAVPALHGFCSWCFLKTEHELYQTNILKRDVYTCKGCHKRTLKCRTCNQAFSRYQNFVVSKQLCAKCIGSVRDWNDITTNQEHGKRDGWCSWCIENCKHILEEPNFMRRCVYSCEFCNMRTLPCTRCKVGMTKGGSMWDDTFCAACSLVHKKYTWEEMSAKRNATLQKERNKDAIIADLTRDTPFKRKAHKEGLLRPFLLLVAMPPIFRNQAASSLGWTLFTEDYFGDAHAEAWAILTKDAKGMQTRCNHSYEKLNVFGKSSNWYDMLSRCAKASFDKDISRKAAKNDVLRSMIDPGSRLIKDVEDDFIAELYKLMQSQLSEEEKAELKLLLYSDRAAFLREMMVKNGGVDREEAILYGYKIADQLLGMKDAARNIVLTQTLAAAAMAAPQLFGSIAAALAPLTAQLALLSTPIFFLGLLGITKTGFMLLLGSTEGRLFGPVALILNQRLLLAIEGINIDEYYFSKEVTSVPLPHFLLLKLQDFWNLQLDGAGISVSFA